jgi:hypothetical protein
MAGAPGWVSARAAAETMTPMNPLLFGPALIRRAVDDLSSIADAARRLASLEAGVLDGLMRLEDEVRGLRGELEGLREDVRPIAEIRRVREGIEPLDEDMHAVRGSVDGLEPLLREVNDRLGGLDGRIETLRSDLAPLGELADKVPGVGRR